jgi:hypothetical protein
MVVFLLVATACATPPAAKPGAQAAASGAESRPLPIPADLAAHIKRSSELGRAIYLQDKASAIGTDVLRENVPDFGSRNLAGWLTVAAASDAGQPLAAYKVMFLTTDQPPRLAFDINIPLPGRPQLKEISPPKKIDDALVSLFRARQTAMMAVPKGNRPRNSVLFPGDVVDRPGSILVYVLTAEQIPDEMVFGIHYRVLVSGDGTTVKELLPLAKSQLVIPPPGGPDAPADAKPVAAFVTHLVTDWPLETHVFVSLLHGRQPIYVGTQRGVWRVVGDQITLIELRSPTDPAKTPI